MSRDMNQPNKTVQFQKKKLSRRDTSKGAIWLADFFFFFGPCCFQPITTNHPGLIFVKNNDMEQYEITAAIQTVLSAD